MSGLLQKVCSLPPATVLFTARSGPATAGRIRATAQEIAQQLPGDKQVYLHTESAALFVSGLLAAALKGVVVFCPAHLQPQYLREIGATDGIVLTDAGSGLPGVIPLHLANKEADPVRCASAIELNFYTSGVTSAPKLVPKNTSQLDLEAATLESVWGARAGHVYATVSHQHIYGMLFRIFWPVLSGRVSEDRPAETWEQLAGQLRDDTTLVTSPAHLTRIPEGFAGKPDLIFSSGAPLPYVGARASHEHFGSLPLEVLGSTETGGIAWRQQQTPETLWTPFPGVRTELDDAGALTVISAVAGGEPVATGDIAERIGEQFRLKGRGDRVAKIDGARVSLPRVEEALLALPMIGAAAVLDLPQRKGSLGAIVELAPEGVAALRELGPFRLSRKLREQLVDRMEPRERPKHWLFAPIPLDRQGKRVQAVLRAMFAQSVSAELGNLMAAAVDGDKAELSLELQPDLVWFRGHFPGEPVMPGVAQLHLAAQWAECLWGFRPLGAALSQVKFRRILRPGSVVRLTLARDLVRQRLSFAYEFGGTVVSEGKIGGVS
jgi:3-hydroxymyristoyl/3-hydroxydecanoyl-(acyl carrier protein) dehydratase